MAEAQARPFAYKDCQFICSAKPAANGTFEPRVIYQGGIEAVRQVELPPDTDAYASAAEALRHAEQQAVRWVNERTGEGQP
jgi:hypothetical protein